MLVFVAGVGEFVDPNSGQAQRLLVSIGDAFSRRT